MRRIPIIGGILQKPWKPCCIRFLGLFNVKFEVLGVLDNNSYTPTCTEPHKNTNFKGDIKMLNINILKKNDIELIHKNEVFERVPDWTRYYISNYGRLLHRNNDNTYNLVRPCRANSGYYLYSLCRFSSCSDAQRFLSAVSGQEDARLNCYDLMDCLLVILYKISNYIGVEFFGCTCFQLSLLYIEFA